MERTDDAAPDAGEEFVVADRRRPVRVTFFGIDEDEIHVGRGVQLAPSELAHAHHDEIERGAGFRAHRRTVTHPQPLCNVGCRARDGFVREGGGGRDHFGQICGTAKIAGDHAQHDALAQRAQARA